MEQPDVSLAVLRRLFWGLLVVAVDVRVNELDLIPDPIGWLVALLACASLARRHRGLLLATLGCGLGLLASLPEWAQPAEVWTNLVTVAEVAVVFGTCSALMSLRPGRRAAANTIRWWDLALTLAAFPLAALAGAEGGVWLVVLIAFIVAALAVFVWFLVLVFGVSGGPGNFPEIGPEPA